jgi:hypothetical protein
MDFKQEADFRDADRRYADLERQRDAGGISEEEFEAQRQRLMVLDGEGRWWSKSPEGGEWHYHNGSAWVRGAPPVYRGAAPEPVAGSTQAPGPARRRRPVWPWLLAAVIILVGLAGIGLIVSSFVPVGGLGPGQGGSAPEEGGAGSDDSGSGSGGTDFDAVFVHRATAENISADNTYLDSDVINDNPDAIVYVTPNWNPGGEGGTYNDHPVGVWYDGERSRWAIFNQDREAMPEGAAFNVFVLESPPR